MAKKGGDYAAQDQRRAEQQRAEPAAEAQTTFGGHLFVLFDEALHYAALRQQDALNPSDDARLADLRAASKERLAQRADWTLLALRRELAGG